MPDLDTETTTPTGTALTPREKRDLQRAQLRPLANLRPELYDEDDYSPDELESMMAMYNGTMASIEEGEIVKSRVLDIRDNLVVLDIGFKSEGTIPLEEFKDLPDLKPGPAVERRQEHHVVVDYGHVGQVLAQCFDIRERSFGDAARHMKHDYDQHRRPQPFRGIRRTRADSE